MALLDFETALGRLVREPKAPVPPSLESVKASAGFLFTAGVQRSWCIDRLSRSASLTLSILPEDLRRKLLGQWTDLGGGTSSFYAAEAEAFLEFIAGSLPDPSHQLTACRFEQATLRASEQAIDFTPPDPNQAGCVRRGSCAGIAVFHGEPHTIIEALLNRQPLPPLSPDATTLLFGPGLAQLYEVASPREVSLWHKLTQPLPIANLLREGYTRADLAPMIQSGILDVGQALSPARS